MIRSVMFLFRWLSPFILALLCLGPTPEVVAGCVPSFPDNAQWLGGDGAYSVPLGEKAIWLFGDSFVGYDAQSTRLQASMFANTVGISTCTQGKWSISYHWGHRARANAVSSEAFFDSQSADFKYWPGPGFIAGNSLYVPLSAVQNTQEGLGFKSLGPTQIARISNPQDDPSQWNVQYIDFMSDEANLSVAATVVHDGFVYFFTAFNDDSHKSHPMILLRSSLRNLEEGSVLLEHLESDGTWSQGQGLEDSAIIANPGSTEMSVSYHPEFKKWILLQSTDGFPSSGIGIRTSDRLEGPWSGFKQIYRMPEMSTAEPAVSSGLFCYAGKEHPEFETSPNDLNFTYVCNTSNYFTLLDDPSIYRPRDISLKLDLSDLPEPAVVDVVTFLQRLFSFLFQQ